MIKTFCCIVCLLLSQATLAQDIIEWPPACRLTRSDFEIKTTTSAKAQQVYAACQLDFGYQMSGYEFMFTKNFNRFARAIFNRKASWVDEGPLVAQLLGMAQLNFDVVELYTRKLRQRMYTEKKAFSNAGFYQQAVNDVQRRYAERLSAIARDTNQGASETRVNEIAEQIRREIAEPDDFCKDCKPKKIKN